MRRMCLLLVSLMLAGCLGAAPAPSPSETSSSIASTTSATWNYRRPEEWVQLYPTCGGAMQSPINFDSRNLSIGQNVDFAKPVHQSAKLYTRYTTYEGSRVYNNGLGGLIVAGNFGTFSLANGVFQTEEVKWHMPAEHTMDGTVYDGEMQIVHKKEGVDGEHDLGAIISIFLDQGQPKDTAVTNFFENCHFTEYLPKPGISKATSEPMDINVFSDQLAGHYLHYGGSTTTPPCTESVEWFVMYSPAPIGATPLAFFKEAFPNPENNRPRQPIGGRLVEVDHYVATVFDFTDNTGLWDYEDMQKWNRDYLYCKWGKFQSPIELEYDLIPWAEGVPETSRLDTKYKELVGASITHKDHSLKVVGDMGSIKLGEYLYHAKEFSFHFPAEHSIDGELKTGEMQILHQKDGSKGSEGLLALAVMLDTDAARTPNTADINAFLRNLGFLDRFHGQLKSEGEAIQVPEPVNLNAFGVQMRGHYYQYSGSLTIPPCTGGVRWLVLAEYAYIDPEVEISFKAIPSFQNPANNRPTQPLSGRKVKPDTLDDTGVDTDVTIIAVFEVSYFNYAKFLARPELKEGVVTAIKKGVADISGVKEEHMTMILEHHPGDDQKALAQATITPQNGEFSGPLLALRSNNYVDIETRTSALVNNVAGVVEIEEPHYCPWLSTTNLDYQMQCMDGHLCSALDCCNGPERGGRAKCPPNNPMMCAQKACSDGQAHCCERDCTAYGGPRTCAKGVEFKVNQIVTHNERRDLTLTKEAIAELTTLTILSPLPETVAPSSKLYMAGSTNKVSALIAQDIINSQQQILPGFYLNHQFVDDKCSESVGNEVIMSRMHERDKFVALGGVSCSLVCATVAPNARTLRIPFIAHDCDAQELSDQEKYPDLIRFGKPTPPGRVSIILEEMWSMYSWTHMAMIHPVNEFLSEVHALEQSFTNNGHHWSEATVDKHSFEDFRRVILTEKSNRRRELFLFGDTTFLREMLCAAILEDVHDGVAWFSIGIKERGWWLKDVPEMLAHSEKCSGQQIGHQYRMAISITGLGEPGQFEDMPSDDPCGGSSSSQDSSSHRRLRDRPSPSSRTLNGDDSSPHSSPRKLAQEGYAEFKVWPGAHYEYCAWKDYVGEDSSSSSSSNSSGHRRLAGSGSAASLPTSSSPTSKISTSVHKLTWEPVIPSDGKILDCFQGMTAEYFSQEVHHAFGEGYPTGTNKVPEPFEELRNYAADTICLVAFMLQEMLLKKEWPIESVTNPNLEQYQEMVSWMKNTASFYGASGLVQFVGNNEPGYLAVLQVNGDHNTVVGWLDNHDQVNLSLNGGINNSVWYHPPLTQIPPNRTFLDMEAIEIELKQALSIVVPLPITGAWQAGRTFKIAALVAQDILNSEEVNPIIPEHYLDSTFFDDHCDGTHAVHETLDYVGASNQYIGVAGMGCPQVCVQMAPTINAMKVPILSFGCATTTLMDDIGYPNGLILGKPVQDASKVAMTRIIRDNHIKYINVIEGPNLGLNQELDELMHYIQVTEDGKVDVTKNIALEWEFMVTLMGNLKDQKHRVIVTVGFQDWLRQIVCAAISVGTSPGITWISIGSKGAAWWLVEDDDLMQLEPACTSQTISEHYQGAIQIGGLGRPWPSGDVTQADIDNEKLTCFPNHTRKEFFNLLYKEMETGYPWGHDKPETPFYDVMAYAVDGICLFAKLFRSVLITGDFQDGVENTDNKLSVEQLESRNQEYYNFMQIHLKERMEIVGLSGNVKFNGNLVVGPIGVQQVVGNHTVLTAIVGGNYSFPCPSCFDERRLAGGGGSTCACQIPGDTNYTEVQRIDLKSMEYDLIDGEVSSGVSNHSWSAAPEDAVPPSAADDPVIPNDVLVVVTQACAIVLPIIAALIYDQFKRYQNKQMALAGTAE